MTDMFTGNSVLFVRSLCGIVVKLLSLTEDVGSFLGFFSPSEDFILMPHDNFPGQTGYKDILCQGCRLYCAYCFKTKGPRF